MTTQSLSSLLKKYNLHPRKGLGQNFLTDPFHLDKIIDAAELTLDDTVLEIGPGPGTLTRLLTEAAGHVIAVELDSGMINLLQNEFDYYSNLSIIQADILKVSIDSLLPEVSKQLPVIGEQLSDAKFESKTQILKPGLVPYKVVANLPYYITSAVIRHLLEAAHKPTRLVVTVQKEVAQRIVAKPGKMSVLAISVQFYGQPELVHHIPAGAFYPPPKVDSAVVRVDTYPHPRIAVTDIDDFFRVVKAGFSQKRKQLKNSLAGGLRRPTSEIVGALEQAGIVPSRRAETLSLEEWGRLVAAIERPE